MTAGELISELERVGVRLWEEGGRLHFRAPKGVMTEGRRAALAEHKEAVLAHLGRSASTLVAEPAARYEPFPLTDMQGAYLVGRRDSFAYGGVACHAYGELEVARLDPGRLEAAWQALVRRHDMLRAVIDLDGSQRVLPEVPPYRIAVADLRGRPASRVASAIAAVRSELDHRLHAPDRWPLFELRVTLGDAAAVLHLSIDFLIADYVSIYLLLDELEQLHADPERELPPLDVTFRDYLLAERRLRSGGRYERDRDYWWRRVDELPAAPELPVLERAESKAAARFRRWRATLAGGDWQALRRRSGEHGVTASGALLAAYAETIRRWSRQPRFTLNVTLLQRLPLHPQVGRLVGDFTSVDLLAVEPDPAAGFAARAAGLQARLWQDLDHRLCSGVEVLRELGRRRGAGAALMPVVYTSAIGLAGDGSGAGAGLGEMVYGISQTPQTWIDCQVMERSGRLELSWDVRDGVFPPGLVDETFAAFEDLVRRLAAGDSAWTAAAPVALPAAQRARRRAVNDTRAPRPTALLHEPVVAQALRTPERTAVVSDRGSLSYGELVRRAAAVAAALCEAGCAPRDLVAVVMEKGAEQVVGVLGALLAGAAYLPVDAGQPPLRRDRMLTHAGVSLALTQSWLDLDWPPGVRVVAVDALPPAPAAAPPVGHRATPDDLAYVIYTSGSTGAPKGVMVSHRAAANTVEDVNRRFRVSADDRVFGLASLGFDLSVYDLFGPLAVGGGLVLPSPERRADPSHWAHQVADHGVTLWNSVPSQMQMLADFLELQPELELPGLRLALLSGDWIPVALPDRVRRRLPGLELVSLGGATEAAIWSIVHPIGEVPADWHSIPYGTPLANQTFHVLDGALGDRPDWVAGDLYIGGDGLALGYLGDRRETAKRFVPHPETGERLYKTGDLGRYRPDGAIELLGREDSQVKIRGHRIELAEVEAAIESHPAVGRAVVLVDGRPPLDRRLAAFVETARRGDKGDRDALDEVARAAAAAGAEVRAGVDCDRVVRYARQLDETALLSMIAALRRLDLFAGPEDAHSLDEILTRARVAPRHHRLVRRWLNALELHGKVERDPATGRYRGAPAVDGEAVEEAWRRALELQPEVDRRTELIDYFRLAGRHLPELLRGELDPVQLLFPEGRVEIHEVAYNDNFLSRYLNRLVTAAACRIAARHGERRPLQVLEAGAGVGGTSVELIPALADHSAEYLFTDVSQFFLNNARERFRDHPWVRFGRFDVNEDYRAQGLAPNSFDLVVCANVLHYARDAGRVLERFGELLQPGGWLVFIEMVRDNYQVLTSMEFLFDATVSDFEDVRRGRDATFIGRDQWHDLLAASGAETAMCLPAEDDVLARIGFHVFAARYKGDRRPIAPDELTAHLARRLPEPMLPSQVQVVDALPLTANGKIDRAALRWWLNVRAAEHGAPGDAEPEGDLERRLAALWAAVIGVERVGRNQNFFELGGDSLLAAQLVGRIREEVPEAGAMFFDGLLRLMLEGPTVAKLASQLAGAESAHDGAGARPSASPLVHLGGAGEAPLRVLVHDASGTLASYDSLLAPLAEHGPLAGLVVQDVEAFLGVQSAVLVERMATDYARLLAAEGHDRVHLVGYDAGGVLAAEVARQLTEAGATVESLTVVAALPWPCRVDDELLVEYLFAAGARVDPVRLGFPAEAALGRALQHVLADTPERVPDGRLAGLTGEAELEGVAWCFRRLAERSPEDRLAAIARALAPPGAQPAAPGQVATLYDLFRHSLRAFTLHEVTPYAGDVVLLRPSDDPPLRPGLGEETTRFWRQRCLGELTVVDLAGDPRTCLGPGRAARVSEVLAAESRR